MFLLNRWAVNMRNVERIEVAGKRAKTILSLYQFGHQNSPSVLFVAGQHGRELTPIFVAAQLIEKLKHVELHTGCVGVVPAVNLRGIIAGTRYNPIDGMNINWCYNDNARATLSEAIASKILEIAENYDVVIDLHAASRARYLPHVIIHREEDIGLAAEFGLNFIIMRTHYQDETGHGLTWYLAHHGKQAVVLELGAGEVVRDADVVDGLTAVEKFLVHLGVLPRKGHLKSVPKQQKDTSQVFLHDIRDSVKAEYDMLICWQTKLGANVRKGDMLGYSIRVDAPDASIKNIVAPASGQIIYLRDSSLVQKAETLFMMIPDIKAGIPTRLVADVENEY